MTNFNLQFTNQAQPSLFANCISPTTTTTAFGATKQQSEDYFAIPANGSSSSMGDNSNSLLNFLKPKRQPQHEQLKQTEEKTKELDALLAKSMAELTFQERQEHQEVLHGVASAVQEDEEQIDKWLQALDQRLLERIANKSSEDSKTSAYQHALKTNPGYVQNRDLRLMFLRGNRYHPESAANQLIRFFATKEGLFGRDKLCKDITLADMDENDKTAILSGVLQVLGQDRTGRQIMLEFTSLRAECPTMQSELRARYYLFLHVLMKSPSAQSKGIVLIIYGVDKFQDQSGGKGFVENTSMALSLPLQFAGVHLCISDLRQYVFCSGALKLIPGHWRARFKVHYGSHLECQYLLSTYGIPIENLPLVQHTNEARMDYHWQWYRESFMQECSDSGTSLVGGEHPGLPNFLWNLSYIPCKADVLFHRRRSNNGGNQRLRALTRHLLQAYNKGNKHEKRHLVNYMLKDIADSGGRFLKHIDGKEADDGNSEWRLVEKQELREKIGQMFRNHRRPNVQQQLELQHQQQEPDMVQNLSERTSDTVGTNSSETERPSSPVRPKRRLILHDDHNDADVLFGRRRNNGGNKLVRKMVAELAPEYETANRARKLEITNTIVEQVQAFGGRFLRKTEDDKWEEVGNDFCRAKISKHFRNHRRPQKPKQPASSMAILGASRNSSFGIVGLPI